MAVSAHLKFVINHLVRHNQPHHTLQYLYSGPTSIQNRDIINEYETRLSLPVRSCFLGNYRVGFGNIWEFLSADSGLRERAHRAEIQETSIAHLPAWEISIPNNDGSTHSPPSGWRSTASGTTTPQSTWGNSLGLTQHLASAGAHPF